MADNKSHRKLIVIFSMVEEINSQCFVWMLVLSMLMICMSHFTELFDIRYETKSSSEVMSGFKPSSLRFEAMVSLVAIIRIRFPGSSSGFS